MIIKQLLRIYINNIIPNQSMAWQSFHFPWVDDSIIKQPWDQFLLLPYYRYQSVYIAICTKYRIDAWQTLIRVDGYTYCFLAISLLYHYYTIPMPLPNNFFCWIRIISSQSVSIITILLQQEIHTVYNIVYYHMSYIYIYCIHYHTASYNITLPLSYDITRFLCTHKYI